MTPPPPSPSLGTILSLRFNAEEARYIDTCRGGCHLTSVRTFSVHSAISRVENNARWRRGGGWKGAASSRILFPSPPPQPRTARASCVRPGIAFPEFLTRCDPTSRGIERRREREGEGVEQLACRVRHNNERGESARKKLRNEGIEADERVTVGSKTLITRVNYPLIV